MMKRFAACMIMLLGFGARGDLPDLQAAYTASLEAAHQLQTPHRATFSLNGVWRVALDSDVESAQPPGTDEFGFVLVPSCWMRGAEFPISGTPHFRLGSWSGNTTWKGQNLSEFPAAWYVREFATPQEVTGRRVWLEVERVTIQGTIYLNGEPIGRQQERESVRWDVTDRLAPPGEVNTVAIRVVALLDEEVKAFLGGDETATFRVRATLRGITGDVWLHAEPIALAVQDVFVETSVRENRIRFAVDVARSEGPVQPVTIKVDVRDEATGESVRRFERSGVALGEGRSTVEITSAWDDAVLWDLDQPHLYQAVVSVETDGDVLDIFHPVTFGFREVWREGRQLILNGKPIHLYSFHMAPHDTFVTAARKNAERHIAMLTHAGFNSIQLGFEGTFQVGRSAQYYKDIFEITDRQGVPVILPIFPVYSYAWHDPADRDRWSEHVEALVRRYRNHPSLIIYAMNFNYLGYGWDMNPHGWASDYRPPDRFLDFGNRRPAAARSKQMLKAIDDSRLIYNHASGNFGDFITSNFYPNWPPIQELGDALSGWANSGKRPLVFVELSLPIIPLDMVRARQGNYLDVRNSEVLQTEYMAMTLGREAYRLESDDYIALMPRHATTEQAAGADKYNLDQPYYWGYRLRLSPVMEQGTKALRPDLLQGWRTYGLSGFAPNNNLFLEMGGRSFEPWHGIAGHYTYEDYTVPGPKPLTYHIPMESTSTPTAIAQLMRANLHPVLLYFGGDTDAGFSAKDHSWFAGDWIKKQLVVINDARRDLKADAVWTLVRDADGATVAHGEIPVEVGAGRRGFYTIEVIAPAVEKRETYTFSVALPDLDADRYVAMDFAIEVFPSHRVPREAWANVTVGLFDPVGETGELLERMGVKYRVIDHDSNLAGLGPLIVGRGVLSAQTRMPPNLLRAVVEDGATLLCLEQRNLDAFNLRLHPRGERVVFPLATDHPALAGLQEEDLRNWRGALSLSDPYPPDGTEAPDTYPQEFWKWGNRGVVTSYMIEKPPVGSLLSLAECGFDLAYTPLAEIREGRGRVILNQMEATLRYGVDPAATMLMDNLMAYAASSRPAQRGTVQLSGGFEDDPDLQSLILNASGVQARIRIHRGTLPEAERTAAIRFVEAGGYLFLVGQEAMQDMEWLPVPVRMERKTYYRAFPTGLSPLGAGIGYADLFIKDRRDDWVPVEQEGVTLLSNPGLIAEVPYGRGRFVLFAIDPIPYRLTEVTPERSNRIHRKLIRMLTTMAASLGAEFTPYASVYLAGMETASMPLPNEWRFHIDPDNNGLRAGWHRADFDDSGWATLTVPGFWENQGVHDHNPRFPDATRPYDGFAWYRCTIEIPEIFDADDVFLMLGAIDDMDTTYINGQRVGQTGRETQNAYASIRNYRVPREVLRAGEQNTIAIRVLDERGFGGMVGPELYLYRGEVPSYPYFEDKPLFNPYRLKRW
jgi:beta-galactosidase